jgi:NAD(P)H-hydrate repair Nnr-like enzyme with NAD(P)H-hydrate dehydratase domain
MHPEFWQRQTKDKPLFPDLLWSRPENRHQAGKLLIVGGNAQGFTAPADAYRFVSEAGVGSCRVVMPDALQKTVGKFFPEADFAPSTPSGSFAQAALAEVIDNAFWADAVLLAGDFGHNSETAILIERVLEKYDRTVTLTKDAVDYFTSGSSTNMLRNNTLLVLSMAQLQRLGTTAHYPVAFTLTMDLLRLIEHLHEFTKRFPVTILTKHQQTLVVAKGGQVSTTKLAQDPTIWRLETAAHASVWWLQNPTKPYEAISQSIFAYLL